MTDFGWPGSIRTEVYDAYLNLVATNGPAPDLWLTGGDNDQDIGTDFW
ncbi:MAG: hypothetical protein JXQ71_03775 [Verrucomicrobia bacterium]|nr:hypothetical protein [Verrucomicrobiota bacterium]